MLLVAPVNWLAIPRHGMPGAPLRRLCAVVWPQAYQQIANEPALPDAVVAPGARATALVNSKFWPEKFLEPHSLAAVRVISC
jgi:hypothetical protein